MEGFKNLMEVTRYFANEDIATNHLIKMRWPNGVRCAHCDHEKVYELKKKVKSYKCAKCRKLFSATKGSIFENSPIPLSTWFVAIYLITSHKKGISSHQLGRDLSISQRSAWFVLHRVRFALQSGTFVHAKDAIIEIDETWVGGETKNKHENKKVRNEKGNPIHNQTPVIGILERGGKIIAKSLPDASKANLLPQIHGNVQVNTKVMTDELPAYRGLSVYYDHQTVNHSAKEYVRGEVHTNGIENFWSLFQRGIIGIYHHASVKHLDKYIDEFEFRFNTRKFTERDRFDTMLGRCNKRLTYAQLTDNGNKEQNDFFKFRPEHE